MTEKCPYCAEDVQATDRICPSCGKGLSGKALLAKEARVEGVPAGAMLLLLGAVLLAAAGLLFMSNATSGVGLITFGCLLAVWARILQAGAHHKDVMRSRR